MKVSDILKEARSDIEDEINWFKGNWAEDTDQIQDEQDLLMAGAVCAVTSVARVCVKHKLVNLEFTRIVEVDHECVCDHCTTGYVEEEVARDFEDVMDGFNHPAKKLLDTVANDLYPYSPEQTWHSRTMVDINDGADYSHEDVMKIYDVAIQRALADEAVAA